MKFYIACIQKLSNIVSSTILSNNEKFVACPSLRVFESSDFKFLSTKDLKQEDFLKREDISMQLNSISSVDNFWDIDPSLNLYDRFNSCLNQLKLKNKKDLELDYKKEFRTLYNTDNTETNELIIYNQRLLEYNVLLNEYDSHSKTINNDLNENKKKVITLKLDVIDKKIALHIAKWKSNGFKDLIENSLSKINQLSEFDQFLDYKNSIKSNIQNAYETGIYSLNKFAKLQIVPFDFYRDEHAWSNLEILVSELDELFVKAKQTLKGFNESILDFDYKEDFISKITLSYCTIHIKRPWLKPEVLNHKFVKNKPATMFLFAKKIVLIKDLRIILKEDLSIKEKKDIDKNSIIKFGPIFMKNQFFKNKISKEAFIKPITNKSLYKSKIFSKIDKKIIDRNQKVIESKPIFSSSFLTSMAIAKPIIARRDQPVFVKPMATRVKPITSNLSNIKLTAKTAMFYKANLVNTAKQSNLHFVILDKLIKNGIYKVEISIQNNNTNIIKNVETDENGMITVSLPKGTYKISMRKNGYTELVFIQAVQENKNLNIKKILDPEVVIYDSYFLMGIVGENIKL